MKQVHDTVFAVAPGARIREARVLEYPAAPQWEIYDTALPHETATPADFDVVADAIGQLIAAMRGHGVGHAEYPRLPLADVPESARNLLYAALGEGGVKADARGHGNGRAGLRVQETAFAGVWRVQRDGPCGDWVDDRLEACEIPAAIVAAAREGTAATFEFGALPDGVQHAPLLLRELRSHIRVFTPGGPPHVINLSLLPLTAADHVAIDGLLGEGSVTIVSHGFSNCRITSTRVRNVWRVRYFNPQNTLILDTIEIVEAPEAARVVADDFIDSIERLEELLAWLRQD